MNAEFKKYSLKFKRPGGTSRGVLHYKETYLLTINRDGTSGTGECAVFRGLSYDDRPGYEAKLQWLCHNISLEREIVQRALADWPSIWFGYEQALRNLEHGGNLYFPGKFTVGEQAIWINGLIWMGDRNFMQEQIEEKLAAGFRCIKVKIGTNWSEERKILAQLRQQFAEDQLELRVDANGAFSVEEAPKILEQLSALQIHSIEQPIKAGQITQMAKLCEAPPLPIALDEELIGITVVAEKHRLLEKIKPQYIILKPSLIGGFSGTDEWISAAEKTGAGWWITSALESNIGLNAIAQYTATKKNPIPQGLGTGGVFENNLPPALYLKGDQLYFKTGHEN